MSFADELTLPGGPGVEVSEQAVLGAVIQSSRAAEDAAVIVQPEHFRDGAHQIVFAAVLRLADDGEPVEPASVLSELARTGMLTRVGSADGGSGGVFLHSLMTRAGSVPFHAVRVRAAWQQRQAAAALMSAWTVLSGPGFDPDVHLDQIRALVDDATTVPGVGELRSQGEIMAEVLDRLTDGVPPGLPTGYRDLDEVTGGMRPGELIVIAARTGVGKSLAGLCIADHVSGELDHPVLFCSLEMTAEELAHRRIAAAAQVSLNALTRHAVSDGDWEKIQRVTGRLTGSRLLVDDQPGVSLAHIRGRLRGMARSGEPARLCVIDYLGLLAEPKAENRQVAVGALARGAKQLAREFAIPVILVVQVNRGPENRSVKVPMLSDLRDSGEVEATADVVVLLHREDYYTPECSRAGEIDLVVAKNRQGPVTTVTAAFQGHYGRISDMAPAEWVPSSSLGGAG